MARIKSKKEEQESSEESPHNPLEGIADAVGSKNAPQARVDDGGQPLPRLIDEAPKLPRLDPVVEVDDSIDPPPPVKRYRVERTRRATSNGHPVMLYEGKTINSATYDVESLKSQGVVLTEV